MILVLAVTTVSSDPIANSDITTSSFPNLVPSTTVDLATDSTGVSFTGTPKFVPSTIVTLPGEPTTSGCVVSISDYSYVTTCADTVLPSTTAVAAWALATSSSNTFPDLVPSSTVNLATDSTGLQTISPLRIVTTTVSSSGTARALCVVSAESQGRWAETACTTTSSSSLATTASRLPLQNQGNQKAESGATPRLPRIPGWAVTRFLRDVLRI